MPLPIYNLSLVICAREACRRNRLQAVPEYNDAVWITRLSCARPASALREIKIQDECAPVGHLTFLLMTLPKQVLLHR
jgi:hypothetical protein